MQKTKKMVCAIALGASLGIAGSAQAVSGIWITNTNGNWSEAARWQGNIIADGAGSTATFTADITATRTITLDSNRTIGNLTFNDTNPSGTAWVLTSSGGSVLTLDNSGAPSTILVSPRTIATISAPLDGAAAGLIKGDTGTLALTNTNTLTGTNAINAGMLIITNWQAGGTSSYNITSNGTLGLTFAATQAEIAALIDQSSSGSLALGAAVAGLDLTNHQSLRIGARVNTTQNNIILNAADTTYEFGGGGATLTVSAQLTGARNLDVRSPVNTTNPQTIVVLSNATNNFTGTTTIGNGAALRYQSAGSVGAGVGRSIVVESGGVAVAGASGITQAQLLDKIATTSTGTYAITGSSAQNLSFAAFDSLRFGALGNGTATGNILPNADGVYRLGGSGNLFILSALQDESAGTTGIDVDIEAADGVAVSALVRLMGNNIDLNAPITIGSTASAIGATATLRVGAQSEIGTGNITLANNSARLQLVDGTSLSNNITFANVGGADKTISMVGNNQNNTLTGTITTLDTGTREVNIDVTTGSTLTITGQITGAGEIEKTGTGTLVLSNAANNAADVFSITSGAVRLLTTGADFGSSIQLRGTGATLELGDGVTLATATTITNDQNTKTIALAPFVGSSTATVTSNITLSETAFATQFDVGAGGTLQINGNLTGTGGAGIDKVGAGLLILAGSNNNYTGTTNVLNGTLLVTGTSNAASPINVAAGAVLGGTGRINTAAIDIDGVLDPGVTSTPATLTLGNGADLNIDGTFRLDVLGSNIDNVVGIDALTLNSTTSVLDIVGSLVDPLYIIATYASLAGTFADTTDLVAQGYTIDYNYLNQNQIALVQTVIPEPSTLALLGLSVFALRRRR